MKRMECFMVLWLCAAVAHSQDSINLIDDKLSHGKMTVTQALTDTSLLRLHSFTLFREVIKKNAKAEKITLVSAAEPGTRITVKGIILKNGIPQRDLLVYVYHTSS